MIQNGMLTLSVVLMIALSLFLMERFGTSYQLPTKVRTQDLGTVHSKQESLGVTR